MHVGLSDTQDDLPGDSDSVEEVVDEAHVVDEGVHVTGAQHEQGGQALGRKAGRRSLRRRRDGEGVPRWEKLLTVKSRAGMGVQRFTWIMASRLGRWPSRAPAKNNLRTHVRVLHGVKKEEDGARPTRFHFTRLPRGREEGSVDSPEGGESHRDGHDPRHDSQQLLAKRLEDGG